MSDHHAIQFSRADVIVWVILTAMVGAFLLTQMRIHRSIFGEPDVRAYLIMAKRLASGGPVATEDNDPLLHHDHTWVETSRGKLALKYPPGFPVMLVPFYWLGGDDGMLWGSPVFGAIGLIGAFVLFRAWMSRVAALAATAALGTDGFVLSFSGYMLSHAADFCVVIWGMACLWRWLRDGSLGWGIAAALLLGFAVSIRPADALLAVPLGIVWCRHAWRTSPRRLTRDLGLVAGGYVLMLMLLAAYQAWTFGSPFTSGYSLSGESHAFAVSFLAERLPKYLDAFIRFVGVPFVVGALGLFLFGSGMDRLLRFLWAGSFLLLYGCYYWDSLWFHWLLRFLLVTFPVFYGAMFGWIDSASGRFAKYAVMAFLLALPFLPVPQYGKGSFTLVAFLHAPHEDGRAVRAGIEATIRPQAVIFADDSAVSTFDARKQFRVYPLSEFHKDYDPFLPGEQPNYAPKVQESRQRAIELFFHTRSAAELCDLKRQKVNEFLDQGRQVVFLAADAKQIERERADLAPRMILQQFSAARNESTKPWTMYEAKRGS